VQYYLRFEIYDDPSRQTTTPLSPDIVVSEPAQFAYGHALKIGDDADDRATWPVYVVADITRMKQIDDPNKEGQKALLFQVYLVRKEEWSLFDVPPAVLQVIESNKRREQERELEGTPLV